MTNGRGWKRLLALLVLLMMMNCMGAAALASNPGGSVLYPVTVTAPENVDVCVGWENEAAFSAGQYVPILISGVPEGYEPVVTYSIAGSDEEYMLFPYDDDDYHGWYDGFDMPAAAVSVHVTLGAPTYQVNFVTDFENGFESLGASITVNGAITWISSYNGESWAFAHAGDTVALRFQQPGVSVTNVTSNDVAISYANGVWSFTMPADFPLVSVTAVAGYPVTVTAPENVDVCVGWENEAAFSAGQYVPILISGVPEGYEPVVTYSIAGSDEEYMLFPYDDDDYHGWYDGFDMPAAAVSVHVTLGAPTYQVDFVTDFENGFESLGASITVNGAITWISSYNGESWAFAHAGDTVALRFQQPGVSVTNVTSNDVAISCANGVWSFTMPAGFPLVSVTAVTGYPVTVTAPENVDVWVGWDNEAAFSAGQYVPILISGVPEGYEPVVTYSIAGSDEEYMLFPYDDDDYHGWYDGFNMPAAAVSVHVTLGAPTYQVDFVTDYKDGFESLGASITVNGAVTWISSYNGESWAFAHAGDTVALRFQQPGVSVTNVTSNDVAISCANGVWSFTMPADFPLVSVTAVPTYPLTVTATGGVSVWTGYENEKYFSEGECVYLFFGDVPDGSEPMATYTVAGDETVYLIDTYDDSDYGWFGSFYMPAAAVSLNVGYELLPVLGTPDFTLPTAIKTVEESAFEGAAMCVVSIPDSCKSIGDRAFKDCTGLRQIRIPADCALGVDVFDGCGKVYVFGTPGSPAEEYCETHDECVFVAEDADCD